MSSVSSHSNTILQGKSTENKGIAGGTMRAEISKKFLNSKSPAQKATENKILENRIQRQAQSLGSGLCKKRVSAPACYILFLITNLLI